MDSSSERYPRVAKAALLKVPESQPNKRTSYRRPVDAQPVAVAPSAPTMSNTARAVAAPSTSHGPSRTSSHRRRQSQQIPPPTSGVLGESVPAAPDVPRAPPSSYRDPYATKTIARGPPPSRIYPGRLRDPTIQVNASKQQPNIRSASDRLTSLRAPPYESVEPLSGTVERRGSQRRPSVPDRSPLQKLEGKLDDISKEERRARILEAELAAQEKAEAEMRARRARVAAEKQQRVVSQPTQSVDASAGAPRRAASNRRHVSLPVQNNPRSPEISDLESEGGYGYDLSDPWDPTSRQRSPDPAPPPRRAGSQRDPHLATGGARANQGQLPAARNSNLRDKDAIGIARGSGSFRDRSAVAGSQSVRRKPVGATTGLGLLGVEDTASGTEVTRSDSKRQAQIYPTASQLTAQEQKRDSRGVKAAQYEMQQQQIDQKAGARNLESHQLQPHNSFTAPMNQKSVSFSEPESEVAHDAPPATREHHFLRDSFPHHHDQPERRYVAPPMLEEWRKASVARLFADDIDLSVAAKPNSGNKAWWEENQTTRRRRSAGYAEPTYDGYADDIVGPTSFNPPLYLKCGPLLRYNGLRMDTSRPGKDAEIWRGSVMIVTTDAQSSYVKPPTLRLFNQPMDILPPPPLEVDGDKLDPAYVDPIEGQFKISRTGGTLYVKPVDELDEGQDLSRLEDDTGLFSQSRSTSNGNETGPKVTRIRKRDGEKIGKVREIPGIRLHTERGVTFWRFNIEIELGSSQTRVAYRINKGPAIGFWVPAKGESMNIMFHSCNGFSFSVDPKEFCGPDPLWRDVLNTHQTRPFHVMIGGGDQIYNDAAMRQTTLFRQWTENKNPLQKHSAPFSEEMQNELEQFYLDRYSMWFSQGLFGMANSQIPMVNIWDDHDIIDGFGSYPHHFMQTPVFTGIGAVAFKYYMLFQHQSVVSETERTEPSWVLGKNPGPYIKERSRSLFMHLGRQIAFLGLDCRTERKRDEILDMDSYDIIFDRLEDEIIKGETKHLIVLLGVPIAYPRLNFLENILTSRLMDPIKALGRAGLLGNFVNKFDGGVEILDDLDDHWTAKHHKEERNWFIQELQHIASTKSVRVTILGGDVHLAAVGQFYTNKKLNIPKDRDHRYMPNVISSAIVNTPPPDMMADILNKRNKVHHLDPYTDEDMIPIFTHDVDGKKRNNMHLLPHRNWCSIRKYNPGTTPPSTPSPPPTPDDGTRRTSVSDIPRQLVRRFSSDQGGRIGRARGPPLSFHNNPAYATADELQTNAHNQPQSSFSPDRSEPERPRSRRNSLSSLFRRRQSVDDANRPTSTQSLPPPQNRNTSQERPSNFHRRPSVLDKKGIQQQGEYINLEDGLDICLNLEVSQHDPAGITTPYRLLVPALNYTAPDAGVVEKERHKSRFGGLFGGKRHKATIGDDGNSLSGSESGSELGEVSSEDEEERTRQRYKVGPRIVIPGFALRKRNASAPQAPPEHRLSSGFHANSASQSGPDSTADGLRDLGSSSAAAAPVAASRDRRQSVDIGGQAVQPSAWESVSAKRHVSAPHPTRAPPPQPQTAVNPSRTASTRNKNPTYNSSHHSQLPPSASTSSATHDREPTTYRRSMGGILNQHRSDKSEHAARVLTHTPSHKKRESYPPHPAIVGAGPGSPYARGQGVMQARHDTTATTTGGSRGAVPATTVPPAPAGYDRSTYPAYPARNGTAGVGARYLGRGRYEDDDDEEESEEEEDVDVRRGGAGAGAGARSGGRGGWFGGRRDDDDRSFSGTSQESFVAPKGKKKWMIWR